MPPFLLAFFSKYWQYLAVGFAVVLVLGGTYAKGRADGADRVRAEDARAIETAQTRNATALAQAQAQALKDQATITKLQSDLTHAADALPDSRPSAVRLALACERLRHQTRPGSKLPAGC